MKYIYNIVPINNNEDKNKYEDMYETTTTIKEAKELKKLVEKEDGKHFDKFEIRQYEAMTIIDDGLEYDEINYEEGYKLI